MLWINDMNIRYESKIWTNYINQLCESTLSRRYESNIWSHDLNQLYESTIWFDDMIQIYRSTIWINFMNQRCESTVFIWLGDLVDMHIPVMFHCNYTKLIIDLHIKSTKHLIYYMYNIGYTTVIVFTLNSLIVISRQYKHHFKLSIHDCW